LQPNLLFSENRYQDLRTGFQDSKGVYCASDTGSPATSQKWESLCKEIENLIGNRDAVIFTDPDDRVVCSKNAEKKLVPASTLKILTALVALYYLGPDYRFSTEFYIDKESNLKIKGYGDPLLLSETLVKIARSLATRLGARNITINDLVLDESYFTVPIVIPGVTSSCEPYDAPNGALCVNFNTVKFRRNPSGDYVSAEPQTPLLPFSLKRIRKSGRRQGRIILSRENHEHILYAGHLFQYFLNKEGMLSSGKIRTGNVEIDTDKLVFTYVSEFNLMQIVSKLFEFSNNFMANQILIAAGAHVYGSPGSLKKGVLTEKTYTRQILKIEDVHIVEGSGISRANKVSAKALDAVLQKFEPYRLLLTKTGSAFVKTGTLDGIRTRAGYIEKTEGELYRFVILINTPGKSPERIMDILMRNFD